MTFRVQAGTSTCSTLARLKKITSERHTTAVVVAVVLLLLQDDKGRQAPSSVLQRGELQEDCQVAGPLPGPWRQDPQMQDERLHQASTGQL